MSALAASRAARCRRPSEPGLEVSHSSARRRHPRAAVATFFVVGSLAAVAAMPAAGGTARIDPPNASAGQSRLFTLVVEPEQEGAVVTMVELYPSPDFAIESFAPAPGWHRDWTIRSERTTVQKATWTREDVPSDEEEIEEASEEDALFRFVGTPEASKTYSFEVRQIYADGSVVHWRGKDSVAFPPQPGGESVRPAPTLLVTGSAGEARGSSTLAFVAIVVGGLALAVGVAALLAGRRRA